MRNVFKYILLFNLVFCQAFLVRASDNINGTSNTIIVFKNDITDSSKNKTIYKFIEYFNVFYNKNEKYYFYFDGWTSGLLSKDEENKYIPDNEISSVYFQYNLTTYPVYFKIGRLYLNEGIAREEQIDGIYGKFNFKNDYKLSLYQGVPQETKDEKTQIDDLVYGGKISKNWGENASIDVSYLQEYDSSLIFRKEMGFALYYVFYRNAYLLGQIDYSMDKERIFNHDYTINYTPNEYLVFSEEYMKGDFKYILPAGASSLFSNFSNESIEKWKSQLDINSTGDYSLSIDFQAMKYREERAARYYGGEIRYRMLTENTGGISFHRMGTAENSISYNEIREFFRIDNEKRLYSFDAMQLFYSKSIYSRKQAYQFSFTSGYHISENTLVSGTIEYNLNSFYKYDLAGNVKLKYMF
ncbi:MAG: hypothetical protein HY934_06135 [Candidatus Firestonebacteria bacterium]|nr:hypothetical protein [Candidatus Firestonebacteria bacterium]